MKKNSNIKIIGLILLVSVFLVGCTTGGDDGGGDNNSGPVTLQWWGVFWAPEVVQSLIDEYESLNPNVTIDYANRWPGGGMEVGAKLYQEELERVLKQGDPVSTPDIFMVHNTWVGNYERFTAPAPASVITADEVKTAFYPAVAADFARSDVVRGLPLWIDTLAVLYNKDLLAEEALSSPPTEWNEFKDEAINLTKRSGGSITQGGFAAGVAGNVGFAPEMMYLLLKQNGVVIQDSNGNPVFATDADSEVALDFYRSFADSGGSWDASQKNDAAAFLEGDLAMLVAPSWRYHDILEFNEKYELGIDIGVATLPQLQGQSQPTFNWADYWGNMVALNRPNSSESWKFLDWLAEPAQLRKLRQNESINRKFFQFLYPRIDMQIELQADTHLRNYNSALPHAQTWYMVDGLAVRNEFKALINSGGGAASIAGTQENVETIIDNKGVL